jgi:hypothetical protein
MKTLILESRAVLPGALYFQGEEVSRTVRGFLQRITGAQKTKVTSYDSGAVIVSFPAETNTNTVKAVRRKLRRILSENGIRFSAEFYEIYPSCFGEIPMFLMNSNMEIIRKLGT